MAAEGGSSDAAAPQWDAAQGVWVGERAVSSSGGALEVPDPLWVFGYGSLCWRIDDEYEELLTARVHGWRRRMAQKSCDHRGTPEAPGVVATMMPESEWRALGLTPEEEGEEVEAEVTTHGVVYRVPAARAAEVLDRLDFREKGGYTRAIVDAHVLDGTGRVLRALVYTANSANPNFMPPPYDTPTLGEARARTGREREGGWVGELSQEGLMQPLGAHVRARARV
jgi:cation transport protein ChaC